MQPSRLDFLIQCCNKQAPILNLLGHRQCFLLKNPPSLCLQGSVNTLVSDRPLVSETMLTQTSLPLLTQTILCRASFSSFCCHGERRRAGAEEGRAAGWVWV